MAKRTKSIQKQLVEYLVAGGAFFWSGYIAFAFFDSVLHLPLFIAKQLANIIGLLVNYYLEDQWVFKKGKARVPYDRRRTTRYIAITIVNFGIDYLIVASLKEAGISPYIGQFVSAGFFTIWNFVWYKYWVFAHHPSRKKGKRKLRKKVS
ncbi:GtrA family protein [Candidatus Saccharibacteria bacterium]|nr:GtrA family protein [Candidatus Saccharibacteria bacterium]